MLTPKWKKNSAAAEKAIKYTSQRIMASKYGEDAPNGRRSPRDARDMRMALASMMIAMTLKTTSVR